MVSSSTRLTAWLQNSKKRGGTVREIDDEQSHRDYLRSGLSASSSACHGLLIITDNANTYKAQRDKNARELKLANAITDMQMRQQRDVCRAHAKYTKELADAKAENDALRDDAAAGRRRLHIKAVCQSVREATTPPAWIMQPPDWAHRWTGLFHPQREADHYAKTTKGTQKYINEQVGERRHDGQSMCNYCEHRPLKACASINA